MGQKAKAVISRAVNKPVAVEEIQVESSKHSGIMTKLAARGVREFAVGDRVVGPFVSKNLRGTIAFND